MKKTILFILICIINCLTLQAQQFQLFTESFENNSNSFTLNYSGPAAPLGNNIWTISNNYSGAPTYPNTISEDSTYSGNISLAPHSNYLHIYDNASGITNANYDPTNQSDNFAYYSDGVCTLGLDSVNFIFFYLCEGSATSYGQVYYSINSGPWVQTGQSQYNNKHKWQYEDITDTIFSNKANIRFGFRWVNASGVAAFNESFSIDDVDIVASYGSNTGNPITCLVDSVLPTTICQGGMVQVYYHLSDTLCDGSYQINLSTPTGTFPGIESWIINMSYPQTSGVQSIQLLNTDSAGTCYKIRIDRISPLPAFTGIASGCFTIQVCPNTITTLQPVVTLHPTDTLCTGSVIDIPFWAMGAYAFGNTYTAQLSDSAGNFPLNPTVINNFYNSFTYDPNLPPYQPGTIAGIVPTVTPGCNYYIRVVSNSPVAIGSVWGPFCIKQCDIQTNNQTDLHFCVTDCATNPQGANSTFNVGIHTFNSSAIYTVGNTFTTQLISSTTFNQIGNNGILGAVVATSDTVLSIHIPCRDSLAILGIPIGMNYLRVIATNSNTSNNSIGSLIRITIGTVNAVGPTVTTLDFTSFIAMDTFCIGSQIYPEFSPYNYSDNSTYTWTIIGTGGGFNGGNPFQNAQGANSNNTGFVFNFPAGVEQLMVQEINNGCISPYGPTKTIEIINYPSNVITGPSNVCIGDTVSYQVAPQTSTSYVWTANNGNIVNLASNLLNIDYTTIGTYQIGMNVTNQCGTTSSTKTVTVHSLPAIPSFTVDTIAGCAPFCANFTNATVAGINGWLWNFGDGNTSTLQNGTNCYSPGTYSVGLTVTDVNGCSSSIVNNNMVTSNSCGVWPGDVDGNHEVDNNDLLPIGLWYSSTGSLRSSVSNLWQEFPSADWGTLELPIGAPDIKNADCNGDGIIDNNDTLAINLNFNLIHAITMLPTNYEKIIYPDLFLVNGNNNYNPGDWVDVEVWVGSVALSVNNLYGIAFNINYQAGLVQPGTESITYPSSWLGTKGVDAITISKIDALANTAYGGISRINHTNISGYGKVADFKFQIRTSLTSPTPLNLSLSNYKADNATGVPQYFNASLTGISKLTIDNSITIAPNPFSSSTTITFNEEQKHTTISVTDVLGNSILQSIINGKQYTIEKGEMKAGIYFVQITDEKKNVVNRKIVVQ